ncbi:hypothetical protein BaRGS_00025274 [Batillaria attramentaria]|uniref:Uncharacterized protein n=1 Tax=Batillaria attramentaria TaxID=370345 RepID=A0ABD0K8Q8_9CAEN
MFVVSRPPNTSGCGLSFQTSVPVNAPAVKPAETRPCDDWQKDWLSSTHNGRDETALWWKLNDQRSPSAQNGLPLEDTFQFQLKHRAYVSVLYTRATDTARSPRP